MQRNGYRKDSDSLSTVPECRAARTLLCGSECAERERYRPMGCRLGRYNVDKLLVALAKVRKASFPYIDEASRMHWPNFAQLPEGCALARYLASALRPTR